MIQPPIPQIETERLLLREITRDDIPQLLEMALTNPKDNTAPDPALHLFERTQETKASFGEVNWGIALKEENKVLGSCGFFRGFTNNTGEIGYYLNEAHRGKGIITEAVHAIVAHGFNTLKLEIICAYTAPDNLRSQAVLLRVGFTQDTTFERENGDLKFWRSK